MVTPWRPRCPAGGPGAVSGSSHGHSCRWWCGHPLDGKLRWSLSPTTEERRVPTRSGQLQWQCCSL